MLKKEKKIVLLDGGMGQELIKRSKSPPHPLWSSYVLMHEPELVEQVHVDFINAGARVITLNTYTATPERLDRDGASGMFDRVQNKALEVAQRARDRAINRDVKIAGSLPPLYGSYKPEAAPSLEECIERYSVIAKKQSPSVDLFLCETMSSIKEAEAAITAATSCKIETWCSLSIKDDKRSTLRSNETLSFALSKLKNLDHQANLLNCSTPESISNSLGFFRADSRPFGAYANGFTSIDSLEIGGTVDVLERRRDLDPEAYSQHVLNWLEVGASVIGGCCEISPAHIKYITKTLKMLDYQIVNSLKN